MADGTDKPIEDVKVGDRVLATDPETGESGPQPVVGTLASAGAKTLVRISVAGGVLVATDNHPLWVAERGERVRADELRAGMLLRTPAGAPAARGLCAARKRCRPPRRAGASSPLSS
ncbi:Hint domain-containing protein [Nonomuraea jabiensis]|uniref:Hint domain-containing protein n=1 Tax=Nonomuraea jabiensis TaxID=882448 RepID=A0A7W9LI05_9ACTN|nr:Hint domain-containing protein [Nonomuraea jabiensis]MBB5784454.1 hypothetical protein [Nonomuraea jabiensis]